jgi:hypothetical protein
MCIPLSGMKIGDSRRTYRSYSNAFNEGHGHVIFNKYGRSFGRRSFNCVHTVHVYWKCIYPPKWTTKSIRIWYSVSLKHSPLRETALLRAYMLIPCTNVKKHIQANPSLLNLVPNLALLRTWTSVPESDSMVTPTNGRLNNALVETSACTSIPSKLSRISLSKVWEGLGSQKGQDWGRPTPAGPVRWR